MSMSPELRRLIELPIPERRGAGITKAQHAKTYEASVKAYTAIVREGVSLSADKDLARRTEIAKAHGVNCSNVTAVRRAIHLAKTGLLPVVDADALATGDLSLAQLVRKYSGSK